MKEFSKKLTFLAWLPFIFSICFIAYLIINYQDVAATYETILIGLVSASGGIAATTNIFYLRKSQVENTYKVKLSLYEKLAEIDLKYLEGSLKITKEYSEEECSNAQVESHFPQLKSDAFDDLINQVNSDMEEATQKIEKEEI